MLVELIKKDIKYLFKNITLYIFFGIVLLFYFSQFASDLDKVNPIKPEPGQKYYGSVIITDKTEEMKEIFRSLNRDLGRGAFQRNGFINKTVYLSSDQRSLLKDAADKIGTFKDDNDVDIKVNYDEYLKIVRELDKKLGRNTCYGDKYRQTVLYRNMTYEEAVMEFNNLLNKDKLTNAYGRLFADYMGITAAFFPIFLSAFILTRDKRSKMHELIYSRSISSGIYIASKFIALVLSAFLIYLVSAFLATAKFSILAYQNSYNIDYLAFFKYTFAWILPTLMFTTAFGMFVSMIFNNGVYAIPLQFVIWMTSLMPLEGNYNLSKILIRFNTVGDYSKYILWKQEIIINRIFYVLISIALLFITALLLEWRRGGGFGIFKKHKKSNILQHQNIM